MQYFIKYLISLIFAIIIILFIQTFIIKGAVIPNQSMSVSLQKFDRVIINKTKVTFDMLKRGDIIMYEYEGKIHFSRIIGEPGESVNIKNHHIYIDDRQLKEKYAQHWQIKDVALRNIKNFDGDMIPPDSFFVLNDNNHDQSDSRRYGLIDKKSIIGNVSVKYYPFKEFNYQFKKSKEV